MMVSYLIAFCVILGSLALIYGVLYHDLRKHPPYREIAQVYPVYYRNGKIVETTQRVTNQEREYLARYLNLFAEFKTDECQQAIITVLLNRLDSGKWGNSIPAILIDILDDLKYSRIPSERDYINVDYALNHSDVLPKHTYYFSSRELEWTGYRIANIVDGVFFGSMACDISDNKTYHSEREENA